MAEKDLRTMTVRARTAAALDAEVSGVLDRSMQNQT